MRGNSATFDEGAHLPAGYTHLALGDHRLNPEQPPLVKLLAAAPLLAVRPVVKTDDPAWAGARQWEFGRRFLYRWNDADRLLFLGRLPVVALASCLLVAVFVVARRRASAGPPPRPPLVPRRALARRARPRGARHHRPRLRALLLPRGRGLRPRCSSGRRPAGSLAAGLATGAAFATKFSGRARRSSRWAGGWAVRSTGPRRRAVRAPARRPRVLRSRRSRASPCSSSGRPTASVAALSPDPGVRAALRAPLEAPVEGLLAAGRGGRGRTRGSCPRTTRGASSSSLTHSEARPTFLLGELSRPRLPALLPGDVPAQDARPAAAPDAARPRAHPAARAAATPSSSGCRSLVYVAFTVHPRPADRPPAPAADLPVPVRGRGRGGGAALVVASARGPRPRRPARRVVRRRAPCATTRTTSPTSTRSRADRANGWRLLVDSNLDWGQDLKRLAAWMRETRRAAAQAVLLRQRRPRLLRDRRARRCPATPRPTPPRVTREIRPGDVVAVSATNLQGVYLDPEDRALMARLRALEPIGRAGWSILIYRADFAWPEAAPATGCRPMSPRLRGLLANLGLAAGALVVSLLGIEAALRLARLSLPGARRPRGASWTHAGRRSSTATPRTRAATSTSTCATPRTTRATAASPRVASTRSPATTPGRWRLATTRSASATSRPAPKAARGAARAGVRRLLHRGPGGEGGRHRWPASSGACSRSGARPLRGPQLRPPRPRLPGALRGVRGGARATSPTSSSTRSCSTTRCSPRSSGRGRAS